VLAHAAANEARIPLSHDISTLIESAFQRTRDGLRMPGVIAEARAERRC
jgi:hypothetical protein